MSSIRKKKKWMSWLSNTIGIFSTRSNLQYSYSRQQATINQTDLSLTISTDLGGPDEDPLPTMRHGNMPKAIDQKYNGTLYRSTTARPLSYDPMIYRDYVYGSPAVKDCDTQKPSDLVLKVRRISGLIKRYLLIKTRDLHRIANLLYFPTIDILIGGLIWLWREQSNPNLGNACTEYLFSLIFWIVANAAQFETCFNFLEEFQSRNLLNLFATMLEHTEWLIASAILCVMEAAASTTICSIIAYCAFGINILSLGWLLPCLVFLFVLSGWIIAVFTAGLFLIFGQRATFLVWAMPYLILPLSAPFYPVQVLPVWAQFISYCLPTTYIFEGIRQWVYGGCLQVSYVIMSFVLTCIYAIFAVLFFNLMFKKSKEKGLARLEQE